MALLALLLLPGLAFAQATQVGQIGGEVKDATGGVLPGATVTLTSVERGFTRNATTDSLGKFLFTAVPIGRYTVEVKLSSFQTTTLTDNLVEAERTTSLAVAMKVAGVEVSTTVVGSTPIVDTKNQTVETHIRAEEFSKLAVGRSYQSLMAVTPGVVGTGNVNSHGALSSNNIFMFDGVNTTDPTTGTFGANLNFEAIQEMIVRTSAVGVEYGRGTGAVVDVITKSGTNRFEGSFKYLASNDNWNAQNSTKSEVAPFTSLERVKFDKVNSTYTGSAGGPVLKDRAWFFFTYEDARATTPQRQTNGKTAALNENYQQTTKNQFWTLRGTVQLAPNHSVWVKYNTAPTDGFIVDYWGNSAETLALTEQNQGGSNIAFNYNGVLGSKWTASFQASNAPSFIDVIPFKTAGALEGGAPFEDYTDERFYNGATFDGTVNRPRKQASGAMEYFTTWGGNSHAVKFGLDWQGLESEAFFRYPTNNYFGVENFDAVTRTYTPVDKYIFEDNPSTSKGDQLAFYVRDKFQLGPRVSLEAGLRIEKQTGTSDIGADTINTTDLSPRISGSYSVTKDNKTIVVGSYGRFYDSILQQFSDAFASVPQQGNYDYYAWNGSSYVFVLHNEQGANEFKPNLDVKPRRLDEFTLGADRQLSNVLGVGARFIWRKWDNFIDDIRTFNSDNTINRVVANVPEAERTYKGIEFTMDKRFSNKWAASGNYTYSQTRGNHFSPGGSDFSPLADFAGEMCRQTTDNQLGDANGVIPCSQVQANLSGKPTWDRPHLVKFTGSYRQPLGPIDLTLGVVGTGTSKTPFSRTRTVAVLLPGTLTSSGVTQTYNYEGAGSDRVEGFLFVADFAVEASYRAAKKSEVGMKFETFNLFNNEEKIAVNNTTWCNATTAGACTTARTNFGTATARASFQTPRTIRVTAFVRF
jgi:hypothetical protein